MTKFYLTLLGVLGVCTCVLAQRPKGDTTKVVISSFSASEVQTLLPQITPKSPNVAGLERHGDYPVSMNSGLANIEIPLHEVKVGNISIPIKLAYHASGNKVNDNASWIGLGWSLTGDYTISRNIRGKYDESDFTNGGSLLTQNLPTLDPTTPPTCLTDQIKSDFNAYISFGKDIERDVFTYHTPFKTNSFVLLPNQTGVIWQEADKSILSYTGALQNLTLRDENGIQYAYNTTETTLSSLTGASTGISAWHLNSIQGIKASDKINFTYQTPNTLNFTNETVDSQVLYTNISGIDAGMFTPGLQNNFYTTDSPSISATLPKEIIFPMGKVVFVPSTSNRLDNLGKTLDTIKVYAYSVSTNQYAVIKKYAFSYVYKQREGSYTGDVVLFLNQVKLVGNDNTILGTYSFSYNAQALPATNSRAKDYWGYYNGQTANTTLIPAITFVAQGYASNPTLQTYDIGGGNREVSASLSQAWMLTQITYPTGGYSNFTYEPHQYQDNSGVHFAGGLRIKQIVSNDGSGVTTTKTYKYGTAESGNGTLRSLANKFVSTSQLYKHPKTNDSEKDYNYQVQTFSSTLNSAINPNEGSTVTYSFVTEYEDDGTGANGKATYTFKDDASDDLLKTAGNGKSAQRSRAWNRGQLLSKIVYGNDAKKKYEQTNTYTTLVTGTSPVLGYLVGETENRLNPVIETSGCYQNDNVYTALVPITWSTGLVKQTASLEKYYDNEDDTKFTIKQSETAYSSTHFQPTEIKDYVSNSIVLGKLLWYPQDFTTVPTTATVTGEVNALRALQQSNVLTVPIEEIDYRKDLLAPAPPDAPQLTVTGGKFMTFDVIASSGVQKAIVPKTISITECIWNTFLNANNSINFTPAVSLFNSSTNTATIPRNVNHKTRMYFDTYDTDGNLLTFHPSDGVTTKYVYGVGTNDGLSFFYPTAETQNYLSVNPNGEKSLTSLFDYTIPYLGMSSMTDASGIKSYFEYDNFGRILHIKDHDSKIVKKYQYQY